MTPMPGTPVEINAVVNPDWLPESKVVAQAVTTTADYYVATDGRDGNAGTVFRTGW
jgi:hypothetical protein